jgi:hypothetical protein
MERESTRRAARLAPGDLRMLWSWAYLARNHRAEAIQRVRSMVASSIRALEDERHRAADPAALVTVEHDLEQLRKLEAQIERGLLTS